MKKSGPIILLAALCGAAILSLAGCGDSGRKSWEPSAPVTLTEAPPGPADLGPATGLSTPPEDAIVFDFKYRAQTGGTNDISYFSFWGSGGAAQEAKSNSFIQAVLKKASNVHYDQNPTFKGREWAAVEHKNGQATALYFDLNADGKLDDNECIRPTRQTSSGVEFITPDFLNPLEGGGQTLCRALLQVNFFSGSEPNCMWSPAAVLEATATLENEPARLLLFASSPGQGFDRYGNSRYALLLGKQADTSAKDYFPRETLSTLINAKGQFYHMTIEGRRSNGLPARALLAKDTSPTGGLAAKMVGSNQLQSTFTSIYLQGVDDKTVFFRVASSNDTLTLPAGAYALSSGVASYGKSNSHEWEVSFAEGPRGTVKAGEVVEVALGRPVLRVRAVDEQNRYDPKALESATYKKGTKIYLEPKITGTGNEVFSRFRQPDAKGKRQDRPPVITITSSGGKQVLSKTMEYG